MRRIQAILLFSVVFISTAQEQDNQSTYDYIASFGAHGHSSLAVV